MPSGQRTTTVIVGAGQSGLAMSRHLADRSVDHVVLERGVVANSWRSRRASLRLLTPNWMTRLPGFAYTGPDPDGYLSAPQLARLISGYGEAAPVLTGTSVTSVRRQATGYLVDTDQGPWRTSSVVVATGAAALASVPAGLAAQVPAGVVSRTAADYRVPSDLPPGGVLVVGASASGVQIAAELRRSGRPVTLAVGEHVRVPRRYRGRDILWWMDAAGVLDDRFEDQPDPERARNLPSMQLVGSAGDPLDLNALNHLGVRLVGRFAGVRDGCAQFAGSLANVCALADLKLGRLLDRIDGWAARASVEAGRPDRPPPTLVPAPVLSAPFGGDGIRSIVWATGFRPDLSWLDVDVFDRRGRVVHDGGVTAAPGLYVLGMPFQRTRRSTLIDGAGADARELTERLTRRLVLAA
ncbi:NAD(P)-binding domain-containing protein [Actinoplanes sp. LDG1-06]|uniref:NAD(P)-binding domain-containing protein n=1 Tax=Paractinoplanes ovalisporus TaxID=2810368 RepID=A0ABS2AQC3_9ACTN|nr:NAD(P)/FAD-dependent oxidoreductase [Actinoplanes ovalisporus]MBM2622063.1 NAD(P)-binding domain-containing protein [Actinoplanes ovalisporus]